MGRTQCNLYCIRQSWKYCQVPFPSRYFMYVQPFLWVHRHWKTLYETGNRAGSVTGRILLSVYMGNFTLFERDEIQETKSKLYHNVLSFASIVALLTLVTLVIKVIRMLLKWKYIFDEFMSFQRELKCSLAKTSIPFVEINRK